MKWAIRRGCHIDRAACAWLIRRFLDPDGEFVFVDDPEDVPADTTPFDMRGVELSHHGGGCSFETFLRHYDLDDPVLWDLAQIVQEADLADERYDAPEAPGLDMSSDQAVIVLPPSWSFPSPACKHVASRATTDVAQASPPRMRSWPRPEQTTSLPSSPSMSSSPLRATITSLAGVPCSSSLSRAPTMVAAIPSAVPSPVGPEHAATATLDRIWSVQATSAFPAACPC
jgi:hypothetical protein